MKDLLTTAELDNNEEIFSLDVKSLYTNVPVNEAIELACTLLFNSEHTPQISYETCRKLMELAVKNVMFMCDGKWYIQKDGVAMGAAVAVILANVWMKSFEIELASGPIPENTSICSKCNNKVTWRGVSIKCDICHHWVHRKCSGLSVAEVRRMTSKSWHCGCEAPISDKAKIFGRYMDDILRSAKTDQIDAILERANSLHKNLEFTIERLDSESGIPFLDMYVICKDRQIETLWYMKKTDTGVTLSFRSIAPVKYKKNIIQGTVHRIFNSTSTWRAFHDGIEKAKLIWEANQYPPEFYNPIVAETLKTLISGREDQKQANSKSETNPFIMQYRGTISDTFQRKLRNIVKVPVIFTTRKLKTCLPSLKCKIPKELSSRVVYQISCPGCGSSYVGQTVRHLSTRLLEHRKYPSPVAEHFTVCSINVSQIEARIIDKCDDPVKLLTLEALHINRKKPQINRKEEYRSRELTLKI